MVWLLKLELEAFEAFEFVLALQKLFICSEISEDVAGFCGLIDLVNLIVDVLLGFC